MRHRKSFNHLSRKSAHRKAMLANMASSLIMHKRITTTTTKAKALKTFVEPLITRSKEDSTHSRRMVFKHLGDKYAVSELFREVALKVGDRPGGYTRIIKVDNRSGDNADMCIIELVDYNENLLAEKETARSKGARRRRGKKKAGIEDKRPAVTAAAEEITEEPTDEIEETVPDSEADVIETIEEEGEGEVTATGTHAKDAGASVEDEVLPEPEEAMDKPETENIRETSTEETSTPEIEEETSEPDTTEESSKPGSAEAKSESEDVARETDEESTADNLPRNTSE